MVQFFTIFTKGGLILWQTEHYLKATFMSLINVLIRSVFMEQKKTERNFRRENYILQWSFANELDLVFACAYESYVIMDYVDELLEETKMKFLHLCHHRLPRFKIQFDFTHEFDDLMNKYTQRSLGAQAVPVQPVVFQQHPDSPQSNTQGTPEASSAQYPTKEPATETDQNQTQEMSQEDYLAQLGIRPVAKAKPKPKYQPRQRNPSSSPSRQTPNKEGRVWDGKTSKEEAKSLDYSKIYEEKMGPKDSSPSPSPASSPPMPDPKDIKLDDWPVKPKDDKPKKSLLSMFSFKGNTLEKEQIDKVMQKFHQELVAKNVATVIATKLCESVTAQLVGQKAGIGGNINTLLRSTLIQSIEQILTPSRSIDVLNDIDAVNTAERRPYSIVFCGVNGVGKSTSLSKVAFYLKHNNKKVMIAACDTFRSGAVEQLRVHSQKLDVYVYETGYGKDPSDVAGKALAFAKDHGYDVVLIDTAGRMQENVALMNGLTKLVYVNKPDLVLFVGEALVGNDGVDQLMTFNDKMKEGCRGQGREREIDGIVLTKFDAIDDKVGAALSMVYLTGHPIVFVGVGQNYTDLRRLNATTVANALLGE
ncbi:putative Signal recognition particle receptor subunit alpha [Blattamonas nauphoetae]|uniref:Signal recognition particle receptor subunit alpha n=1 Tax=Blattamonas nauphoetae TaxID=2049346 RepID=A0ABQ9Y6L4_9EUKA|nr:putative Signal recognition particle receptor subunit alpha [Blattamonas nauphoetae]